MIFPKIEQLGHMARAVADPKILANGHELYINFELLVTSSMTSLSRMCLTFESEPSQLMVLCSGG